MLGKDLEVMKDIKVLNAEGEWSEILENLLSTDNRDKKLWLKIENQARLDKRRKL